LHIAAVVDVEGGEKPKLESARKSLEIGHLITLDSYANQTEADIEDVLGREFYVSLVNQALEWRSPHEVPLTKPVAAPERIAKEIEQHNATLPAHYREYNHFIPAEWLYRNQKAATQLAGFDAALGRMEKLIATLNGLL
jgi:hypothetical protein